MMPSDQRGGPLPRGGGVLEVEEYVEFLAKEYLSGYVARGGAAVKLVVVGDDAGSRRLSAALAETAADGFVFAAVDAAGTRVHMVDQLFAAIARQVDWVGLAGDVVRRAYEHVGFPAQGGTPSGLSVSEVAAYHEVDATELYRSARRALEHAVLGDSTLAHEFRVAMLRLCQSLLGRGDVDVLESEAVLGWLRGERVPAAQLRAVSLFTRVARHNARPLLLSLARWLPRAGRRGLIVEHFDKLIAEKGADAVLF